MLTTLNISKALVKSKHCPLTILGGKHAAKEKRSKDRFTNRQRWPHNAVFHHVPYSHQWGQVSINLNAKIQPDRNPHTSGRRVDCLNLSKKWSPNSYQEPLKFPDALMCFWKYILKKSANVVKGKAHKFSPQHCWICKEMRSYQIVQQ